MAETMAEAIGRPWGRDYRRLRRIPGFHKFVKKGEDTACDRMMEYVMRPDRDVRLFFLTEHKPENRLKNRPEKGPENGPKNRPKNRPEKPPSGT